MRRIACITMLLTLCAAPLLADTGDAPARAGRISVADGAVAVQAAGQDSWDSAVVNDVVTTGDQVATDTESRAEIELGFLTAHLDQSTGLVVTRLDDQVGQLALNAGTCAVTLFELPENYSVEVDTPDCAVELLRQGSYRISYDPDQDRTTIVAISGSLELNAGGPGRTVRTAEAVSVAGPAPGAIGDIAMPAFDDFDLWCRGRDDQVRSSASAQYVDTTIPGVEDLDRYGRWESVAAYGPVWFPEGVPASWVPYRFGRWLWESPWGWTWVESEPWGFCPFHYGRWAMIEGVWGWIPGPRRVEPVFAPALVAFVDGGGLGVEIGVDTATERSWCPLGPGEPYVPWYHCTETYVERVNRAGMRTPPDPRKFLASATSAGAHHSLANQHAATTALPIAAFRTPPAESAAMAPPAGQRRTLHGLPYENLGPAAAATVRGATARTPVLPASAGAASAFYRRPAPTAGYSGPTNVHEPGTAPFQPQRSARADGPVGSTGAAPGGRLAPNPAAGAQAQQPRMPVFQQQAPPPAAPRAPAASRPAYVQVGNPFAASQPVPAHGPPAPAYVAPAAPPAPVRQAPVYVAPAPPAPAPPRPAPTPSPSEPAQKPHDKK